MHIAAANMAATPPPDLPGGALSLSLLNGWQHDFPLTARPFAIIGGSLGLSQEDVIARYELLQREGYISRIGAVVQPNTVGASTLAALAVPRQHLEEVAAIVSAQEEVTHNYERAHRYNLWFVIAAPDQAAVSATLARIERQSGLRALNLPMRRAYHIDLGFALPGEQRAHLPHNAGDDMRTQATDITITPFDRALLAAIEDGLPLVPEPFAAVAEKLGCAQDVVIRRLAELKAAGIIRRFGVVVRHRKLGFLANAMVVWDVPDELVQKAGQALAKAAGVTLCYERRRQLPHWRYNLFCMIHGRARDAVRRRVRELAELLRDELKRDIAHEALFSRRCFKQRGARFSLKGGGA